MHNDFYDLSGQRERRSLMISDFTREWVGSFDESGLWIGPPDDKPPRMFEWLHYCLPFFASGDPQAVAEANNIIRGTTFTECVFSPMLCLIMLTDYRRHMDANVVAKMEAYVIGNFDNDLHDDFNFVGVNDNFPLVSTYIVLATAQMFGIGKAHETGIRRLEQFKAMLQRRGVATEYNSPSYTSLQVNALAQIAEHIKDAYAVELALQLEQRLWVDFFGHFHPVVAQLAGPFSRTYRNGYAGPGNVRNLFYALLGDRIALRPDADVEGAKAKAKMMYSANTLVDLHCPTGIVEWALNRPYPYEFKATSEFNSSTDDLPTGARRGHHPQEGSQRDPHSEDEVYEYPSGVTNISTYMAKAYALGVASKEFHNGSQTESFFLVYPRTPKIERQRDIRTLFARYIVNDKLPGETTEIPEFNVTNGPDLLWDMGRKIGVHHQNTAMILYRPKDYCHRNVKSMRLMVIMPLREIAPDEIRLGNQVVEACQGVSETPCSVYIRDAGVYLAIHPLSLTDYGRSKAVAIETANDFLIISFYNYEGDCRDFARRGFMLTSSGFVCEVGSQAEDGSFDQFIAKAGDFELKDQLYTNPHIRQTYVRETRFIKPELMLECEYSPISEGIRYIAVNGAVGEESPKLSATGLDIATLPFMGQP